GAGGKKERKKGGRGKGWMKGMAGGVNCLDEAVYAKIAKKMTMSATIAAHTPRTIVATDGIRGGRRRVTPGVPEGDDEMTAVGFQSETSATAWQCKHLAVAASA